MGFLSLVKNPKKKKVPKLALEDAVLFLPSLLVVGGGK